MTTDLDIPGGSHVISSFVFANGTLSIRLVMPYFDEADFYAYEIEAQQPRSIEELRVQLSAAENGNTDLWCEFREGAVFLTDEDGSEIVIRAKCFRGCATAPNAQECLDELKRARELYEWEWKSAKEAHTKLHSVRSLLVEQLRRLELKSQSHQNNPTVATLYEQNTRFLVRLVEEIDSRPER